jgi:uncharacterized protein (DUF934 family)
MPNLIRHDALVTDDAWQRIEMPSTPAELPGGPLLLPLATWLEHHEALRARGTPLGVWLASDEAAESLNETIGALALVAIHFPVFSDGRGYSNARILRERLAYRGELRAIGDVLRDQLFLMRRCGFDSFEIRADRSAEDALASLRDFHHAYQYSTADPGQPLLERGRATR